MYFPYGQTETDYLKRKDARLGVLIDQIGPIYREINPDLFSSVVQQIIGQQISTKAQLTIWNRMQHMLGVVSPQSILAASADTLQSCGISFRKADSIRDFAQRVESGTFDLAAVRQMPDADAIAALSACKGIGEWTAEMILLFCLARPNILSFHDFGIQRGLRMVYHHRAIDRKRFEIYRRRFSPYCSVASLYLWAIAGGAVEGLRDYAPARK